jgi:O-antigen ligase
LDYAFQRNQALGLEYPQVTMMNPSVVGIKTLRSEESMFALVMTLALTMLFVILVLVSDGQGRIIALFPLVAVLLLCVLNFELSLFAIVLLLFLDYPVFMYHSVVLFSIPFGLSFLVKHRTIERKIFSNPLTPSMVIYGLCIIPSFLNAAKPLISFFMLLNILAFLIVFYLTVAECHSYSNIHKIVIIYLGLVILNSFDVFRLSLLAEKRQYGFAGIWFVDYSALGVCLAVTIAVILQGFKRLLFFILSFIIVVALVLTQTRNTWISAVITLGVLIGYLFMYPHLAGLTRKRLFAFTTTGLSLMIGVVLLVLLFNPKIEKRAVDVTDKKVSEIDEWGYTRSSLVTRMFIWDTALNAFREHPLIGIGVYAFPYSSHQYSRLPEFIYSRYVEKLPPHQTHLAVLAETGIVGFMGFLIFIGTALKLAFTSITLAKNEKGKQYALVAAIGVVYCIVSMFFTDAWLWGQQLILLSLVLGLMLAIRKINTSTHESEEMVFRLT